MNYNKINLFSKIRITSLRQKVHTLSNYYFYMKISTIFLTIITYKIYYSYNNPYQNYNIEMGNVVVHSGNAKTDAKIVLL